MKVALFGFGYWGKKIYSILDKKNIEVLVVDKNPIIGEIRQANKQEILEDESVSHCFIITPEETHFYLAKECLLSKKNVFVEKPLSLKSQQARELTKIAKKNNLYLAVDQVFLYDVSVAYIKKLIEELSGSLIKEVHSKRWSVLHTSKNINVIQDLMPHDLYIYDYLKVLDCSILNKNDINKSINKEIFSKERSVFSFENDDLKFSFDYDWYAKTTKREMTLIFSRGEKIVWKKMNGFDEVSLFKDNKIKKTKKIIFKDPSPLELLINDFFDKKTKLSLEKTADQVSVINFILD